MLFVPMIAAAEEDNSGALRLNDFIKPNAAKEELNNSAFSKPTEKASNWGTIALIVIVVLYFAGCVYKYYTGDDEERSNAFKGLFVGVIVLVLFMACTSTALDALTWQY